MSRNNNLGDIDDHRICPRITELERNVAERAQMIHQQHHIQQHRMRQQLQQLRMQHHIHQQQFQQQHRAQHIAQRQQQQMYGRQQQQMYGRQQQHLFEREQQQMIEMQREQVRQHKAILLNQMLEVGAIDSLETEAPTRPHVRDMINLFNRAHEGANVDLSGRQYYETMSRPYERASNLGAVGESPTVVSEAPTTSQQDKNVQCESGFGLLGAAVGGNETAYDARDVNRYAFYEAAGRIPGYATSNDARDDHLAIGTASNNVAGHASAAAVAAEASGAIGGIGAASYTGYDDLYLPYHRVSNIGNEAYGYSGINPYGYAATATSGGIADMPEGAASLAVAGAAMGAATEEAAGAAAVTEDTISVTDTANSVSGAAAGACAEVSPGPFAAVFERAAARAHYKDDHNRNIPTIEDVGNTTDDNTDEDIRHNPRVEPNASSSMPRGNYTSHSSALRNEGPRNQFRIVSCDQQNQNLPNDPNKGTETAYASKTKITRTARGIRITIDILFTEENELGIADILNSYVETSVPHSRILREFQRWTDAGGSASGFIHRDSDEFQRWSDAGGFNRRDDDEFQRWAEAGVGMGAGGGGGGSDRRDNDSGRGDSRCSSGGSATSGGRRF